MKTSAISSPVNLTPGNSNAAKAANAEEGGPSFGQVLSREMAAPPKANGPDHTQHKQAARAEDRPGKAESSSAAAKTNGSNASKASESNASDKAGSTDAAKPADAQASAADAEPDDSATASTEAEDLLALVASLTQAPIGQTGAEETGQAADNAAAGADAAILDAQAQQSGQLPTLATLVPGQSAAAQEIGVPATEADPMLASAIAPSVATDGTNAGRARAETIQSLHDQIAPGRARGGAMQSLNERANQDAAANDDAPGVKNSDGKPAQAGDPRLAADNAAARAEAANQRFAATDAAFAKSLQDAQPAAPAPGGIGAAAPAQLQPVGIQPAQAAPGQFADRLAPRVGTPGWDQALGQKVIWMVGGEQQSASLTLNPPDLGPLQVVLSVSENQATANFTASQAEVRQALEAALPKLREMLGEAGIQLGQANVSAGTPDNQPNPSAQPERSAQGGTKQDDKPEPQVRVSRVVSGGQGLVDTFA